MAASGGILGSPSPAVLGDALDIVPSDPHGNQNCPQRRCIFSVDFFITVLNDHVMVYQKIPSFTIVLYYVLI